MAAFNKFDSFVEAVMEKKHDLGSDTLKVVLTNTAPSASNSQLSDITQISNGNGYTTGGATAALVSSTSSGGAYVLKLSDVTWTASGSMGPFRYAVLYNDTASNDELIGWWDFGSSLTLVSGESYTVDFDATLGVLALV